MSAQDLPTVLAACPFCGSGDVQMHPNDIAKRGVNMACDGFQVQYAHCDNCGAEGPQGFTSQEAIAAWNRRASDAEIARLRAAHGWQSIETAPEGDLVLCWCPKAHRGLPSCEVLMVYHGGDPVHASGRSYWTNGGPNGGEDVDFAPGEEPTHWQPLPKEAP